MLKIVINCTDRTNNSIVLQKIDGDKVLVLAERTGLFDTATEIANILSENTLTLKDIAKFDFVDGVGSFTGTKMAAAVANVLEWSVNKVNAKDLKLPKYEGVPNIQK